MSELHETNQMPAIQDEWTRESFSIHSNDSSPSSSNLELSDIGIYSMMADTKEAIERGSGFSLGKEKKSKKDHLRNKAFEALNYAKQCINVRPKPLSKEEMFCNYLCTEIKQIKLDTTFRRLKLEILMLVDKKIEEENKIIEVNQQVRRGFQESSKTMTTSSSAFSSLSQFAKPHSSSEFGKSPIMSLSLSPLDFPNTFIIKDKLPQSSQILNEDKVLKSPTILYIPPQSSAIRHHVSQSPPIQEYLPRFYHNSSSVSEDVAPEWKNLNLKTMRMSHFPHQMESKNISQILK